MVDLSHLDLNDEDDPIEVPHDFEIDLNCVVTANHSFALEGIKKALDKELAKVSDRDEELYVESLYDDLRRAANNLAIVALVTRFHHWITKFVGKLPAKAKPSVQHGLETQLNRLNGVLGNAPVPVKFFKDLAEVRNSIIHADSKGEWTDNNGDRRQVNAEYRNAWGDVEISEGQLRDAIAKAIQQVKWYERMLSPSPRTPKSRDRREPFVRE